MILLSDPIEGHEYRQPCVLPPGRVAAVRVKLAVMDPWPQLGGQISGVLEVFAAQGGAERVPLEPLPLGDVGWANRYWEFRLSRPVTVTRASKAVLTLTPHAPVFPRASPVRFLSCWKRNAQLIGDLEWDRVTRAGATLCLTLVYAD
jgi:hypothetical protein